MTGWCQCNHGGLLKEKGRWISVTGRRLRKEAERLEEMAMNQGTKEAFRRLKKQGNRFCS